MNKRRFVVTVESVGDYGEFNRASEALKAGERRCKELDNRVTIFTFKSELVSVFAMYKPCGPDKCAEFLYPGSAAKSMKYGRLMDAVRLWQVLTRFEDKVRRLARANDFPMIEVLGQWPVDILSAVIHSPDYWDFEKILKGCDSRLAEMGFDGAAGEALEFIQH